ncbi:MAG TPA: hypothetical protein VKB14_03365 [Actinomycetales bacterium]|nr:hypothetical protein [Actinomycetales bacterium]
MPIDLPRCPRTWPSWEVRRPTPADVDTVLALLESVDRATLGFSDWSRDDVEADLGSSSAPADRSQLLVLDGDRALAWAFRGGSCRWAGHRRGGGRSGSPPGTTSASGGWLNWTVRPPAR